MEETRMTQLSTGGDLRWPDLGHPDTFNDGIPYDLLAEMRRAGPVVWVDEPRSGAFAGGPGFWAVLRHAEVSHVSRHPEEFSSWLGTSFLRDPRPSDVAVLRRMMLNMDPPDHTKLRRIVNKAFTPQVIRRQLQASIEAHARAVVDAVCERGEIDFLTDVAAEMPLLVLADILGVPSEDRGLLYGWTNRLVGLDDPEYGGDPEAFVAAFTEMFAYARRQTERKRENPTDDVWSTVVNAEVDGERLSAGDLDRFFQLLMIAGNETTRNLIAGGLTLLDAHPDQRERLLSDLTLLPGAVEEMLRFSPPVIQFRRTATRDTSLAGQAIKQGEKVVIVYASANRDEDVFDEPDRFDIARDLNRHLSFGDGTHFCLGANLARLEARVLFTELLTRLPDIRLAGPPERMRSSFINGYRHMPVQFTPVARPRLTPTPAQPDAAVTATAEQAPRPDAATRHDTPLLILYGSNFGTAEEVASNLARDAEAHGFRATLASLDERVDDLPRDGAVLITSSTYNGTPPDNAREFADWLKRTSASQEHVRYAVFGCGDRDWEATFQEFPKLIDTRLAELGATRIRDRGEGDASGDFDADLAGWERRLWSELAEALGVELSETAVGSRFSVELLPGDQVSPFLDSLSAKAMRVVANRELVAPAPDGAAPHRSVRHVEVALPEGVGYRAGDHLGVIPHNRDEEVERVARRFRLSPDAVVRVLSDAGARTFLPVGERVSVRRLLGDYVELAGVATRRNIATMLEYTEYPSTRDKLAELIAEDGVRYREEVLAKRKSVLDLLDEHPTCELPFHVFLEMLPPLAPRYYSISSSPLVSPRHCAITVGHLSGVARSGLGVFHGVCSSYLCASQAEKVIYAFVRDTGSAFRLPDDPERPLIMLGAGTGIAPFRGFLQERAALRAGGSSLGRSLLLFGCRHPQHDDVYADELRALARASDTRLALAYSRLRDEPRMYVQDRLLQLADDVWELLDAGAVVYVCGATAMAEGVRSALRRLHERKAAQGPERAEAWLADLSRSGRYLVDVWASE
jgi:cytochrome P450/NADPH-cytochrome P450 reductase